MKPIKLIKSFVLEHKTTGLRISPYGTIPYGEIEDWEKVNVGYTVYNQNGTIGNGRMPFATLEEAKKKYPELPFEE